MKKNKLTPFDVVDYLKEDADIVAYLEAAMEQALEEGHSGILAEALGDIARAKGIGMISKKTGLSRQNLYKSLSKKGNPEISTIFKIVSALGLRLVVAPANNNESKVKRKRKAA